MVLNTTDMLLLVTAARQILYHCYQSLGNAVLETESGFYSSH